MTLAAAHSCLSLEARLFAVQRLSAMLLAPLVIVHLVLIVWAVQGGLSAAEILERTRGSAGWAVFYSVFVAAASVHAPIGVRNVLREWTPLAPRAVDACSLLLGILLALLGARAIWAVVAG